MPVAKAAPATAINGKIYVFEGDVGKALKDIDIYDIKTNTWSKGTPSTMGDHVTWQLLEAIFMQFRGQRHMVFHLELKYIIPKQILGQLESQCLQ
ncbi:kelch repeat-containing protein [Aminipila terrae]|uniref:Uncharacterized protein n=1 Tax=Aminipila terrae TaxID=2697030 RepID=A0A6P1MBJ4_9FIRM|nr:kelch repeat-containing protein [Aminipila terrae]QHI72000.1 hypothetical protein Ami3637_05950 [Aminipila terrae]